MLSGLVKYILAFILILSAMIMVYICRPISYVLLSLAVIATLSGVYDIGTDKQL